MSRPGDPAELEADRVADLAARTDVGRRATGSPSGLGRQRKAPASAPKEFGSIPWSEGRPLEPSARSEMEELFGHDFSGVRVHADARASESARALNARAYTAGDHVVFATGAYSPSSSAGRKLLAHELAHVVQRSPVVQRQADGGGVNTGDLSKALGRRLPERKPRDIASTTQEIADEPPDACLKGPRCALAIPGSTLDARRRYRAVEGRKASEMKRSGKSTELQPAVELTRFFARHAKSVLAMYRRLRQKNAAPGTRPPVIYVDPSMGGGAGAWTIPCPDDKDASCISTDAEREANAAKFNDDPDAAEIGGEPRDEWKTESLQMFHHEAGHVRFGKAPVRGTDGTVPAVKVNATHLELSEMFAQLSEWPVLARHAVESTPSPDERPAKLRETAVGKLLTGDQNFRGILDKIRCMNPCEDANRAILETFERAARSWPRWMRDALVEVLTDPEQQLGWPMPRTPGWRHRKIPREERLVPTRPVGS